MALKDIPSEFRIDSEEEVRFAVAQFFNGLDFDPNELSFEDHFSIQLGRTTFRAENSYRGGQDNLEVAHGYSDLLLTREGTPLAVVEVKRFDHPLNENDGWQAISYARLLRRRIAPYAIVTNGKQTKIYDPLADSDNLVEINQPTEAIWHRNGQSLPTINDDLKSLAAKKLIGISPHTLQSFCENQVDNAIDDLKGEVAENKIYIPDVYLVRESLSVAFDEWLTTQFPCFGLVGESGVGKSNFMCATAQNLLSTHFVLFYSAQNLQNGLIDAIVNDFIWEFRRDRNIAQIASRLDDIASSYGKSLVIFLDAIDEYIGEQASLKAELRDFIYHINNTTIRICISCKAHDWGAFVIDNHQNFNRLAKATYPQKPVIANPEMFSDIDARSVGFWLSNFTSEELDDVFKKYQIAYSLSGELAGQLRLDCQMPLNLRLLAEVYRGQTGKETKLPTDFSTKELFNLYWQRKINRTLDSIGAERLLTLIAEKLISSGKHQISLTILLKDLEWSAATKQALEDIIRLGLVQTRSDGENGKLLSFVFEKLRVYTFVVRHKEWNNLSPAVIATEIISLLDSPNRLKIDAVRFFLTEIDRGETEVLTEVALSNLKLFLAIVDVGFFSSAFNSPLEHLSIEEGSKIFWNRVLQYVSFYSKVTRHYLPHLSDRFVPYTKNDVGVWVSEDGNVIQFRATTEQYPQPILILKDNDVGVVMSRKASRAFLAEIGSPAGTIHIGSHGLEKQLPQKVAWDIAREQLVTVLKKGMLDETTSPTILEERIRRVLLDEPSAWYGDYPDQLRNYEKLGYAERNDIYYTSIEKLVERSEAQFLECARYLSQIGAEGKAITWWREQLSYFFLLKYWLGHLKTYQDYLLPAAFTLDDIFASLRKPYEAVPIFQALLPGILDSYCTIVERNFPYFLDFLSMYKHRNTSILVEITHNPFNSPASSDYIEIRYIILPSVNLPQKHIVYACEGSTSIAHKPLAVSGIHRKRIFQHGVLAAELNGDERPS